ncbi:hypothetical protein HDV05_000824, partial [Chytridiales sp. JEL 0842]
VVEQATTDDEVLESAVPVEIVETAGVPETESAADIAEHAEHDEGVKSVAPAEHVEGESVAALETVEKAEAVESHVAPVESLDRTAVEEMAFSAQHAEHELFAGEMVELVAKAETIKVEVVEVFNRNETVAAEMVELIAEPETVNVEVVELLEPVVNIDTFGFSENMENGFVKQVTTHSETMLCEVLRTADIGEGNEAVGYTKSVVGIAPVTAKLSIPNNSPEAADVFLPACDVIVAENQVDTASKTGIVAESADGLSRSSAPKTSTALRETQRSRDVDEEVGCFHRLRSSCHRDEESKGVAL